MSNNEEAVQIILDRMRTNPEEFYNHSARWRWLFNGSHKEILSEEERKRLQDGLDVVRRLEFKARVLETLLAEDAKDDLLVLKSSPLVMGSASTTGHNFTSGIFDGLSTVSTVSANTLKIGQATLHELDIERLKCLADDLVAKSKATK